MTPNSVEHFKDDRISIRVEQPPEGFWVSLTLVARIPLSPDEVFGLLTNPENSKIFRGIKAVPSRRVISDDGRGRQEVEVEQVGQWRFGPLRGSFAVKLLVMQDRRHHKVAFRLAPTRKTAFMKDFSGVWEIQPYNKDSLDEMVRFPHKHWGPLHEMQKALHRFEERLIGNHADSSLVKLQQCVAPNMVPPAPFDRWLKRITIAQVQSLMEDLINEAERRKRLKGGELKDHIKRLKD